MRVNVNSYLNELEKEHEDLVYKTNKLKRFIEKVNNAEIEEKDLFCPLPLLVGQHKAMQNYVSCLDKRITLVKKNIL